MVTHDRPMDRPARTARSSGNLLLLSDSKYPPHVRQWGDVRSRAHRHARKGPPLSSPRSRRAASWPSIDAACVAALLACGPWAMHVRGGGQRHQSRGLSVLNCSRALPTGTCAWINIHLRPRQRRTCVTNPPAPTHPLVKHPDFACKCSFLMCLPASSMPCVRRSRPLHQSHTPWRPLQRRNGVWPQGLSPFFRPRLWVCGDGAK